MRNYINALFKVRDDFLENFLVRILFFSLIIFGIGLASTFQHNYSLFQPLLPIFLILLFLFAIFFIILNRKVIRLTKNIIVYLIFLFVLLFSIFNAFHFDEYTIDGGHDPGVYLESAILLSKTGHYLQTYSEKSLLLSYLGFWPVGNDTVKAGSLPGYPVYLSIFYNLLGVNGFPIALSFTLFFSSMFIFFLGRRIKNWQTGFIFLVFFLFNYYTFYYSRATWVENLQLLLIWFYVYLFIRGYLEKKVNLLLFASLPISLLMSVRFETVLYFLIYFLLLLYFYLFQHPQFKEGQRNSLFALPVFFFSAFMILNIFLYDPQGMIFNDESPLRSIVKTILNPGSNIAWGPKELVPYDQQLFQSIFVYYVLGPTILLISILSLLNIFREDSSSKKTIILLSLLIIPQFVFLVRPSAQFYLPWVMRRYWAVFLPYTYLLFGLFLTNQKSYLSQTLKNFLVVLLFIISILPGLTIINFSNGKGILDFQKAIASNFGKKDLVIFWDRYAYEYWGPLLYFLHDTNVLFDQAPAFNREIYALFMKDYKDVYIATSHKPNESLYGYFENHVSYLKTIESPTFRIIADSSCHLGIFSVHPETFESYSQITDLCSKNNPPIQQKDYQISLNIYKINDIFKDKFVNTFYDSNYRITRQSRNIFAGE